MDRERGVVGEMGQAKGRARMGNFGTLRKGDSSLINTRNQAIIYAY